VTTLIIGCGYLGERVGLLLSQKGEAVFGTVRSQERAQAIARLGIEPVIADVLKPDLLGALPAAERIFYSVGFDRAAGSTMRAVYVDGLNNVLVQLYGVGIVERFVQASSTSVYGQSGGEWVNEQSPAQPVSESGRLVLEAEEHVRDWARRRGGPHVAIALRFAGLYGPGRVVRLGLVKSGEPIPGDPDKLLNMIHIDDAAQAAVRALEMGLAEPLYLACDDRPATRREYYNQVAMLVGAPPPRFEAPQPGSVLVARDLSNKRISNRRMKAGLGVELIYPDIQTGLPAALFEGRSA
jgi:nucleoside-diphosphate-sugar epimerase